MTIRSISKNSKSSHYFIFESENYENTISKFIFSERFLIPVEMVMERFSEEFRFYRFLDHDDTEIINDKSSSVLNGGNFRLGTAGGARSSDIVIGAVALGVLHGSYTSACNTVEATAPNAFRWLFAAPAMSSLRFQVEI